MPQTIMSLMSLSLRFLKLQFFAVSHRSVTYRSIGSTLSCTRVLNRYLLYSHVLFRVVVFFKLREQNIDFVTMCVVEVHCIVHVSPFWVITTPTIGFYQLFMCLSSVVHFFVLFYHLDLLFKHNYHHHLLDI